MKYRDAADALCIAKYPSCVGQETEEIADLIIARMNPQTREVEYFEILPLFRLLAKYGKPSLLIDAAFLSFDAGAPTRAAQRCSPNASLTIGYDRKDDLLNLDKNHPHVGQTEIKIDEGITARPCRETGEIENLEIHSFKVRSKRTARLSRPSTPHSGRRSRQSPAISLKRQEKWEEQLSTPS